MLYNLLYSKATRERKKQKCAKMFFLLIKFEKYKY